MLTIQKLVEKEGYKRTGDVLTGLLAPSEIECLTMPERRAIMRMPDANRYMAAEVMYTKAGEGDLADQSRMLYNKSIGADIFGFATINVEDILASTIRLNKES